MGNHYKSPAVDSRSTYSLSAIAKAITRFLFGEAKLPLSLSHFRAFFAGLATGAVSSSALYVFLNREQCDRAKVQLVVYHIIRFFQHHTDYAALLQDPQELLARMDPEVMRMVDKHLTVNEAGEVIKELKRNYVCTDAEKYLNKRVRGDEGNGQTLAPAPRGFLLLSDTEPPNIKDEYAVDSGAISATKSRLSFGTQDGSHSDTNVQDDEHANQDVFASDQKQPHSQLEQFGGRLYIGKARSDLLQPLPHVPQHLFATQRPSGRRSAAPVPEPNFVGHAPTPTTSMYKEDDGYESELDLDTPDEADYRPISKVAEGLPKAAKGERKQRVERVTSPRAPGLGSFGLDYNSKDLYSSDSSSDNEDPQPTKQSPHNHSTPSWPKEVVDKPPPTVVRKLHGVKCSGTSLSPIRGSPSTTEGLPATGEAVKAVEQAPAKPTAALPFSHWSTIAELDYSSNSEDEATNKAQATTVATTAAPASPPAAATPVVVAISNPEVKIYDPKEETGGLQGDENRSPEPFSPSNKLKSPGLSPPVSPSPKRVRSTPLTDITALPAQHQATRKPLSPPKTPMKRGRGRGRTGAAQASAAKTPATRKTTRQTAYNGTYTK